MRFSIWPTCGQPWTGIAEVGQHAERTGWDGIWLADHFMPVDGDVDRPMLECFAGLAALAALVPRLRIGSLVAGNTYRHPAVLAKAVATVDQVAPGRVVLGIGAGWQQNEHVAYGIELPSVRERLDRLEEACEILVSLLHNDRTTLAGRHYHLTDAPFSPKPSGALPILVGGGGERRTMRIAARFADEWNVWGLPALLAAKGAVLDRHCEELGRDPSTISRSANALLLMSDDAARVASWRGREIERPAIVGTPPEVVEIVAAYRDAGVSELVIPDFTFVGDPARRRDVMDSFIGDVAAAFR